ncbi:MAG: DUF169 domain-containing protein [Desulfobacteraceae bacterium]|nr:DUF169 domain-containing protein [Desulfobacteraceae bacterium]
MDNTLLERLPNFMMTLGLTEAPMGIFYTDEKPANGFSPKSGNLPTREKEIKNEIDWQEVFSQFSCVMGNIWRARKKNTAAYFSSELFGCPGGAFWMGFNKPQVDTIINYVSTGIPNQTDGERYCDSPESLKRIFEFVDPRPAPESYCVVKPVEQFSKSEHPELVAFFTRPESLAGLHQLAAYVTNDPEVVVSPWGAACGNVVAWPLHYLEKGRQKATLGGWDPSARKFFKTDELSFTIPYKMFKQMLERYESSFLTTKTWQNVQRKIEMSKKKWGEVK